MDGKDETECTSAIGASDVTRDHITGRPGDAENPSVAVPIEQRNYVERHSQLQDYQYFGNPGEIRVCQILQDLLSCNVSIVPGARAWALEHLNIDIRTKCARRVFVLHDGDAAIICPIEAQKQRSHFIVILHNLRPRYHTKILNSIGYALSNLFRVAVTVKWMNSLVEIEQIPRNTILSYLAKARRTQYKFSFVISMFERLRSMTYEGEVLSTGLVVTVRDDFLTGPFTLSSDVVVLDEPVPLRTKGSDKRFWFIVDGRNTAYLCDHRLSVDRVLVRPRATPGIGGFLEAYALKGAVTGRDVVFRILESRDFSILPSYGKEFINIDGVWRYRDFADVADVIRALAGLGHDVYRAILYHILALSHSRTSSIIWIPGADVKAEDVLLTLCRDLNGLSVLEDSAVPLFRRMMSSDGCTVIDRSGALVGYGGMVDLSGVPKTGLVGSGASASLLLSNSGTVVKISQDGTITIFSEGEARLKM